LPTSNVMLVYTGFGTENKIEQKKKPYKAQ